MTTKKIDLQEQSNGHYLIVEISKDSGGGGRILGGVKKMGKIFRTDCPAPINGKSIDGITGSTIQEVRGKINGALQ